MVKDNHNYSQRIFGLDVFRAIAILVVVLGHGKFLLNGTILEGFPYLKIIDGVDLFFVLSGFLIGSILLKLINKPITSSYKTLIHFWKRRWFRTLPNYYLILGVNYLIVYFGIINGDIEQFNWKFLLFLQNFSNPFKGFFWESWSLSIEEWFYLLSPILLFLLAKKFPSKIAFLLVTLTMLFSPFIYRIIILNPTIDPFLYDIIFRKTVLTRLDSIAYGLLAAWFYYYHQNSWNKFKWISLAIGIILLIFINSYKPLVTTFYKQVLYFSLSPLAAMCFLPIAHTIKKGRGRLSKWITHISKISYSMYLINLALVAQVIRNNYPPVNNLDGVFKYLLYWVIVILGSTILYKYFEKPMMDLRDR